MLSPGKHLFKIILCLLGPSSTGTEGSGAVLPAAIPCEVVPRQGVAEWQLLVFFAGISEVPSDRRSEARDPILTRQ